MTRKIEQLTSSIFLVIAANLHDTYLFFYMQAVYCEWIQAVWDVLIWSGNCNFFSSKSELVSCVTHSVFCVSVAEHLHCFIFHSHTSVTVGNWRYLLSIILCRFVQTHAWPNACDREISVESVSDTRCMIPQSSVILEKERWNPLTPPVWTSVFP